MARGRFNFYLNFQKDDELLVAERIDDLKRRRSFTSVIREGIIIISELREGRVDTLLAHYPWIVDVIKAPQPPPDDGDLRREIADLKRIMLERGGASLPPPPAGYPQMKQAGQGIGKLGSISLAMPTFDDDDNQDTLQMTVASGKMNGGNLLTDMFGVAG